MHSKTRLKKLKMVGCRRIDIELYKNLYANWVSKIGPHLNIAPVLQGEFPDKNTQEDGYVGVAPVDAFPAQNKFGKIYLFTFINLV